jgi:hypothetical protein
LEDTVRSLSRIAIAACALLILASLPASADSVALNPVKDNTLYESPDGSLSNGAGANMFAGKTFQPVDNRRRAVMAFDIAGAVPAGAGITSAQLTLNVLLTIDVASRDMSLHRLEQDWGEGTSVAPGGGGAGATSTPGDATWLHTDFPGSFWNATGGDFAAAPSATTLVGFGGPHDWTGPGLVADAQSWLDDPGNNFGWILIGDEVTPATARKFGTREDQNPDNQPLLVVVFEETTPVDGSTWGKIKALLAERDR